MTRYTTPFAWLCVGCWLAWAGAPAAADDVQQDWMNRYTLGADDEEAKDIDLDQAGNVYVTGQTIRNTQSWDWDYITIKYNSNGQRVWVRTYNSPGNGHDRAYAIDVDSVGNVYVTGESDGDCVTIKYNTSGAQVWLKRTEDARGYDIQVEPLGENNVFVTGRGASYDESFTIRYNSSLNGQIVWTKRDVEGYANALAVTHAGNVYITGEDSSYDYFVATYAFVNGARLWIRTFDRGGVDVAHDVVTDDAANVYVTGESRTSETDYDAATVSWDLGGALRWSAVYNGPANGWDKAFAIALDDVGNVRIAGFTENTSGDRDFLAVKYAGATGAQMWAATHGSPAGDRDVANDLTIDGDGSVYLTGHVRNAADNDDYMTVKFDTLGALKWSMTFAGPASRGHLDDNAFAIAVNEQGYVFVTGKSYGPASDDDIVTICYSQPSDPCPCDLNDDDIVDVSDLLMLLAAWGNTSGPEDINDDGMVDVADLLLLLADWGPCPRSD